MVHPALESDVLVLCIVREVLRLELGDHERRQRLDGLLLVSRRLLTVCRAWRNVLGAYLGSHAVLRMHREPKQSRLRMLASASPRGLLNGRPRSSSTVGAGRAALRCQTNVPQVARVGVSRVKTIVLAVHGTLDSKQVAACIEASQFGRQPWPAAKALHIELHAGPDDGPLQSVLQSVMCSLERMVHAVLAHAPFVSSLVVTQPKPVTATSSPSLSLALAFGDQCRQLKRVDVGDNVLCTSIPAAVSSLTSLTVALEPGLAPERLAGIAASPLQRLTLINADEADLAVIFCGARPGAFDELRALTVSLRVRTVGLQAGMVGSNDGPHTPARHPGADEAVLVLPRLETVSVSGFRQAVPAALLRAVAAAPVRSLLLDMTIRNAAEVDFRRMAQLRRLEVLLPYHDDVQAVLDAVFAGPATLLAVSISTQTPLRGLLPDAVRLANLRRLRIDTLVALEGVWRVLRQLPRLVFLETKAGRRPEPTDQAELVPLDDVRAAVLGGVAPVSGSLQVLDIWHKAPLCTPAGAPTRLGAEIVAHAAAIPTLQRLGCCTAAAGVRAMLAALLGDDAVAAHAPHLGRVDVRTSCLQW